MAWLIQCFLSYYSRHVEFLGDPIKVVTQVGIFGSQVLHLASFLGRDQEIQMFLECGADINAKGDLGLTPLHYAVLGGHSVAILSLIHSGAARDIENEFGETPRQMAQLMSNMEIKDILRGNESFDVLSTDDYVVAGERWVEFRRIQELNFPKL